MTKIDLITGFLGSGKTTLLKSYLNYLIKSGEKVCVLEFDYGAVNVDMMLLQDFNDKCDIEMVAGGCDYDCHQRRFKTKLISMGMKHYDRVVIEPSGIFNPIELFDVLNEEPLNSWFEIGSIISVVDPHNLNISSAGLEMLVNQISYSGIVYLSKSQDFTSEELAKIIRNIITLAKSFDVNLCSENIIQKRIDKLDDSDFEKFKKASYREPIKNLSNVNFDSVFSTVYILNSHVTLNKLREISNILLESNSLGNVIRVKGFVNENDKWFEFNKTKSEYSINEVANGQDVIIVIGEKLDEKEINGLFFQINH